MKIFLYIHNLFENIKNLFNAILSLKIHYFRKKVYFMFSSCKEVCIIMITINFDSSKNIIKK